MIIVKFDIESPRGKILCQDVLDNQRKVLSNQVLKPGCHVNSQDYLIVFLKYCLYIIISLNYTVK